MNKKEYLKKWQRDNTTLIVVRLNNAKHHSIINYLKTVPNVSEYVRTLIEKDIAK